MKYILYSLAILVVVNALALIKVYKAKGLEKSQKTIQIFIVLLLPFLGAALIYWAHRYYEEEVKPNKKEFGGGSGNDSTNGINWW